MIFRKKYLGCLLSLATIFNNFRTIKADGYLQSAQYFGSCLHVQGASKYAGAGYDVVQCNLGDGAQQLNVVKIASSTSDGVTIKFDFNQLCMTGVDNGGEGALLLQQNCDGNIRQNWEIVTATGNSTGWFQLKNKQTGFCLTLQNGGTSSNTTTQNTCDPVAPSQYWSINYVPEFQNKNGLFYHPATRACLALRNETRAVGTDLELQLCNFYGNNATQMWNIRQIEETYLQPGHPAFYITDDYSGNCVTVSAENSDIGTRVQMFGCIDSANPSNAPYQAWTVVYENLFLGSFSLKNLGSGLCLTYYLYGNDWMFGQDTCDPAKLYQHFTIQLPAWYRNARGAACQFGYQCMSNNCQSNGQCFFSGTAQPCQTSYDCSSKACNFVACASA